MSETVRCKALSCLFLFGLDLDGHAGLLQKLGGEAQTLYQVRLVLPSGEQGAYDQFTSGPAYTNPTRSFRRQPQRNKPLRHWFRQCVVRPAIHALERRLLILSEIVPTNHHARPTLLRSL